MSKKLADYDYVVQFVMGDIADFKRLWGDEEFRKTVKPDHVNFADETRSGFVSPFIFSFFSYVCMVIANGLRSVGYRLGTGPSSLSRGEMSVVG